MRTQTLSCCKYLAGATALAALVACGGGGGDGGDGSGTGTLKLALTDAPSCGYDAVNVTVQKIRVHQSATAADDASGWHELTLNPARRVDLLSLTNGVLEELGELPLPTGNTPRCVWCWRAMAERPPSPTPSCPQGRAK